MAAPARGGITREEVEGAIKRGVRYLKDAQDADGSWSDADPEARTGTTSLVTLDILVWGLIATLIQLLAFAAATALLRGLRDQIEAGNLAAASALVGIQLAVAVVNAGAMAG